MIVSKARWAQEKARADAAESQVTWLRHQIESMRTLHHQELAAIREGLTPKPLTPKKADPVLEAIAQVSGDNAGRRKRLGALAAKMRRNKMSDEEIITKLTHWQSTDDDDDSQAESLAS